MLKKIFTSALISAGLFTGIGHTGQLSPVFQTPGKVLFEDDFSKSDLNPGFKVGQNTQWHIENEHLVGRPATAEYQASKPDHNGTTAMIDIPLKQQNIILKLDVKFDGKEVGGAIEFGHKVSSVKFSKSGVSVSGGKTKDSAKFKPELGKWYSMIGEVQENELVVTIDGVKTFYVQDDHLKSTKKSIRIRGPKEGSISLDNITMYDATGDNANWDSIKGKLSKSTPAPTKSKKKKKKS